MKNKQVLFVDDQRFMHELVRPAFQALGCQYRLVTTIEDGLEFCGSELVSANVCDIQIGSTSGLDFVDSVRSMRRTANVPIIMLSQYADQATIDRAMACGADDYIIKPFKLRRVADALRQWLTMGECTFASSDLSREQARLVRMTMSTMGRSMATARTGEELPYQLMRDNCLSILQAGNDPSIVAALSNLKNKDIAVYLHSIKYAAYLGLLATGLQIDKNEMLDALTAGLLHDIGMALIPISLTEKSLLSETDRENITRQHVEFAKNILSKQPTQLPKSVRTIPILHHERLDGTGPLRFTGENMSGLVRAACIIEEQGCSVLRGKLGWHA
ncbi:MAG: response regulator [Rhodospirillaceae bacterium]